MARRRPYPRVAPGTYRHPTGAVEHLGYRCGSVYYPDGRSVHLCFGSNGEFAPWITGKGPRIAVVPKTGRKSKS